MRRLQEKFGKTHPELEGVPKLHPELGWLRDAFFRLHRRRQVSETGLQPLSFQDITHFADRVIELPRDLTTYFTQIMEETDLAVLHDYYQSRKESA